MTTTRSCSLLLLFTLAGVAACSSDTGTSQGGTGGAAQGGAPGSGSSTSAPPTSGGAQSTGGIVTTGGTVNTGGTVSTGGKVDTGGAMDMGGSPSGGKTASGGTLAKGGASGSGGKTGSGGIGATSGSAGDTGGGAAGAGGAPLPGSIPTGYPPVSADNYAKCQKVAIGDNDACGGQPDGNICIECLFGGSDYNSSETSPTATATSEAGNYLVTVQLGGADAGDTYVSAESTRGMLQSVTTTPGQSLTYAFVVNVRDMEGQPNHAGGPGGYPGLDLFFSGKNPQVSAIGYALAGTDTKPIMVYMASDSTECDQTGGAFGGWGQMLPEFFGPPIGIANYGNSGASSSSFYGASDKWGAIKAHWTKGDWAIIQFGHNDKTDTDAQVQANLTKYVNDAKTAGVNALLVSPPARATSIPIGDQSSLHAASAKAAAAAGGVPYVDLTALSTTWYNGLGMTKTQVLQAYHAGGTDQTHTNLAGAEKLAGLVANDIKTQNIGLAQYLRQ
jgi:lysophospholipase L1-like esterase